MDIPIISQSSLRTLGVTQPVVASTRGGAITPESHPFGNPVMKKHQNSAISQPRQGEERVDISEMARLLYKGLR